MIRDVYEPLARYRDEFAPAFRKNQREKFSGLVDASGVDILRNRALVAAMDRAGKGARRVRRVRLFLRVLCGLAFFAASASGALAVFNEMPQDMTAPLVLIAAGAGAATALFLWLAAGQGRKLKRLEARIREMERAGWEQMRPLNELYTWDLTTGLIEQTVPRLHFDPYFSARRLDDLRRLYGWSDDFNDGRSMLFALSGAINGNPFVFGEFLDMEWRPKEYTGTLSISWTEHILDADGRSQTIRRHQTLTASVVKPAPAHFKRKMLVYGNDAAPNLVFSRTPSELSGKGDGLLTSIRKRRGIRRLQKLAEKKDSNYAMMANQDFELLFHATDRSDEVEFRLLFTALAQSQMLALLQDTETGFGDDFVFLKRGKVNLLFSDHLDAGTIDTDPRVFMDYDFDRAARGFLAFNEAFFKNVYFSLAPLLAIPLYQQTRSHEDIYRDARNAPSSFWEHEAVANFHGAGRFRHRSCVTESILKTRLLERTGEGSRVAVTAHGFRGVERVEHVTVYGGDGRFHAVPVHWTEYFPVERTSEMRLSEGERPADFDALLETSPSAVLYRSIYSYLPVKK